MSPDPWPRRLLDALPPMPDWLWVACWAVVLFLSGMAAGVSLCLSFYAPSPRPPTAVSLTPLTAVSLQNQLQSLEQRVRALEQR
jgi:hypothetical protein